MARTRCPFTGNVGAWVESEIKNEDGSTIYAGFSDPKKGGDGSKIFAQDPEALRREYQTFEAEHSKIRALIEEHGSAVEALQAYGSEIQELRARAADPNDDYQIDHLLSSDPIHGRIIDRLSGFARNNPDFHLSEGKKAPNIGIPNFSLAPVATTGPDNAPATAITLSEDTAKGAYAGQFTPGGDK